MKSSRKYFLLVLLAMQCLAAVSFFGGSGDEDDDDDYYDETDDDDYLLPSSTVAPPAPLPGALVDACAKVPPKGGVAWIKSQWNAERGWGEHTPRALVALAMAGLPGISQEQLRQMELQLDVEITTLLLKNHSRSLHPTDLVQFVQALLAIGRNPRDFYGRDLVALLKQFPPNHPALLLGLCDARAVDESDVYRANNLLRGYFATKNIDYMALALKAYTCLQSLDMVVEDNLITQTQKHLISLQLPDGSFGNLYTTSLVVQALATTSLKWNLKAALRFLDAQSILHPNMVSSYLVLMAQHSETYSFVKDIHPDVKIEPVVPKQKDGVFVQYSVKTAKDVDQYLTFSVRMPRNATFYDVMVASRAHDSRFEFESYEDKTHRHHVYSISGVPNDAEGNLFWHLCLQTNVNHQIHIYDIITLTTSPSEVKLTENDHFIYWFRDTDCRESKQTSNLY